MRGKIFKFFIILLVTVMICSWIFIPGTWVNIILTNIFIVGYVVLFIFPKTAKWLDKEINDEKAEKANNLLSWCDTLDGGDNYLKYIFRDEVSKSIPSNLSNIRNLLFKETDNDISKLRDLRAYFKTYKERQTTRVYFKTIGTGILSFTIFLGQAFLQGRLKNQYLIEFFHSNYSLGIILAVLLAGLYYFLLPHRGENRLNLIVNILDEIIEGESNKTK